MRRSGTVFFFMSTLVSVVVVTAGVSGKVAGFETDAKKNTNARKLKNPVANTPASISAGEQTFQKYCRFCHGKDAKGNGPLAPEGSHPPNLTDEEWKHGSTDGDIFAVIRDGAGPESVMKPFDKKLTEREIWDIVNYLRSLGPNHASHVP